MLRARETQQADLLGRPLTDAERERGLREDHIDEEVLLHEALGRGLQWSDFPCPATADPDHAGSDDGDRARSIGRAAAGLLPRQHRALSPRRRLRRSCRSCFPRGDEATDEQARGGARQAPCRRGSGALRQRIRWWPSAAGCQGRPAPIWFESFGPDFADRVEQLPAGEWQGPVESLHGVHLVREVEQRHPPQVAEFENLESYLRQDWLMTRMRDQQQEGIDEIRAGYRVELVGE